MIQDLSLLFQLSPWEFLSIKLLEGDCRLEMKAFSPIVCFLLDAYLFCHPLRFAFTILLHLGSRSVSVATGLFSTSSLVCTK